MAPMLDPQPWPNRRAEPEITDDAAPADRPGKANPFQMITGEDSDMAFAPVTFSSGDEAPKATTMPDEKVNRSLGE